MQQPAIIYTISSVILGLLILLLFISYKRKKTAEHLYHDAMMKESSGSYEEAIHLYQQYLDRKANRMDADHRQVELRIKTLRILSIC